MTYRSNGFAGQTVGANVTVANSADSGDPFTSVSPGVGAIKYAADPAGGALIAVELTPAANDTCFLKDASYGDPKISVSDCFYYDSVPAADQLVHQVATAAGWAGSVYVHTDGKVNALPHSGSAHSASSALTPGHWYRIETQALSDASAGSIACQWYIDDGATQTGSITVSSTETRGGDITTIYRGLISASATTFPTWAYARIQAQDGTLTPLGPFPSNTAPTADAGDDQTGVEPYATVTLDGTGSSDPDGDDLTYAWTQTAGTTVTLSSSTAAQPTFTAPATLDGDTLTFSLTVNDGTTDSDPDTVDVTVLPHTWWQITNPTGPVLAAIRATIITD